MPTQKHTDNVLIGNGLLYVDLTDEDGAYTGEREFGAAESAVLATTTERTEIYAGSGVPVRPKVIDYVRQIDHTLTLTLQDISPENLALFVAGDAGAAAAVNTAKTDLFRIAAQERWLQLGATKDRPGGVRPIAGNPVPTVKHDVALNAGGDDLKTAGTAAVAGTDYEIDLDSGRLWIAKGGALTAGKYIAVGYTGADPGRAQVTTGSKKTLEGAIRYVELENPPGGGKPRNYYARLCSIGAGGEFGLVTQDAEQRIQLTCAVQEPGDGWPALAIDGEAA